MEAAFVPVVNRRGHEVSARQLSQLHLWLSSCSLSCSFLQRPALRSCSWLCAVQSFLAPHTMTRDRHRFLRSLNAMFKSRGFASVSSLLLVS